MQKGNKKIMFHLYCNFPWVKLYLYWTIVDVFVLTLKEFLVIIDREWPD